MGSLIIRNLDDDVKAKLKVQAAEHGRSMEAQARAILAPAVLTHERPRRGLGSYIHRSFGDIGGVDRPPADTGLTGRGPPRRSRMIILDTNVLSEIIRPAPNRSVRKWLDEQLAAEPVINTITAAELRAGAALMPDGRRRNQVGSLIERLLDETFARRVLPFGLEATPAYALIVAIRQRVGRPVSRRADRCGLRDPRNRIGNTEHQRFRGRRPGPGQPWQR